MCHWVRGSTETAHAVSPERAWHSTESSVPIPAWQDPVLPGDRLDMSDLGYFKTNKTTEMPNEMHYIFSTENTLLWQK